MPLRDYTAERLSAINSANSYGALRDVALEILAKKSVPVGMVCGPLTNGGRASPELRAQNFAVFNRTIEKLCADGNGIFNQIPFEDAMARLIQAELGRGVDVSETNLSLLTGFYLPLFEERKVGSLYFISGWRASSGACWEHAHGLRLGLQIKYLPINYHSS